MLTNLTIHNYRSLKEFYIDGLARVNLIVGSNNSGKTSLLEAIYLLVNQNNPQSIVVDADQDLAARWQAIKSRLRASGYQNIPETPPQSGLIHTEPELPKVGVWLMPNNQLPGMLEDFVKCFIPNDDKLLPKAELVLQ